MTDETARALRALAHLVHHIRPDWDEHGILAKLTQATTAGRRTPDLALAAIRAAAEPSNRTPAVIPFDGPHWAERVTPVDPHPRPYPHPVPTVAPDAVHQLAAAVRAAIRPGPTVKDEAA